MEGSEGDDGDEHAEKEKEDAGDAPAEEKKEASKTPDSAEDQAAMAKIHDELLAARQASAANSALRQLAFMNVPFQDEPKTTTSTDGEGNVTKKTREADEVFLQDLYSKYIDKYGQLYVQYCRFRELVTVEPLMPDKNALLEIKKLEREGEEIAALIDESQIQLDEEVTSLAQDLDQKEGEEKEATERQIENARSSA